MIDFVYKLKDILPDWPLDSKLTLEQISHATKTSVPHVIQYFSDGLQKSIDVTDRISHDEAKLALSQLCVELRSELEQRSRELEAKQNRTVKAFHRMMMKVRPQMQNHQWRTVFRTLSYFAGENRDYLPDEYLTTLCSDIIRIGIKADENIQELGRWLEIAVAVSLHQNSRFGVEEALDFIDVYSEFFIEEPTGKGALLLGNLLSAVEERAARFGLWEEYQSLINQLYPPDSP